MYVKIKNWNQSILRINMMAKICLPPPLTFLLQLSLILLAGVRSWPTADGMTKGSSMLSFSSAFINLILVRNRNKVSSVCSRIPCKLIIFIIRLEGRTVLSLTNPWRSWCGSSLLPGWVEELYRHQGRGKPGRNGCWLRLLFWVVNFKPRNIFVIFFIYVF